MFFSVVILFLLLVNAFLLVLLLHRQKGFRDHDLRLRWLDGQIRLLQIEVEGLRT